MEDNEVAPRGYFPGSRTPLPTEAVTEQPARKRELATWDSRPNRKFVGGTHVDFFAIGAVCAALGRPAVTIRLWIRQGHLPASPFRMPDRNGVRGRRLYTREQIEALIVVAEAHGIRDAERVDWSRHTTFADDIRAAWDNLK